MTHVFVVTHTDMETDTHVAGVAASEEGAKKLVADLFEYIGEEMPVADRTAANERQYTGIQLRITITELELSA
jgi:hypothetical protein